MICMAMLYQLCIAPESPHCRMMHVYAKKQKKPKSLYNPSHIQKDKDHNVVSNRIIFHSLCSLEPWCICATAGNTGNQSGERVSVTDVPIVKDAKLFLWKHLARDCFPSSFFFSSNGCFSLTQ